MKRKLLKLGLGATLGWFVMDKAAGGTLTLEQALDNTNLVWTTTNNYPWSAITTVSFDGVASAASGNQHISNSVSWVQTTVTGPGMLSFWWSVSSGSDPSQPSYAYLQFLIDGIQPDDSALIAGSVDWNYRTYAIPAGAHMLQWQYVKTGRNYLFSDQGYLDQVLYTTNPPILLQAALNACGAAWTSGGNTNFTSWFGQTNMTHDGSMAAQSGAIADGQQTWLQTTVSGVTNVSFWWRLSSYDAQYDPLGFYIDGNLQANIAVEEQWVYQSYSLSPAQHTLQWAYQRNDLNLTPRGQDCGWVDQVVFSPPLPGASFTLTSATMLLNGQFSLVVSNGGGCPCRVQYVTNLTQTNWMTLASLTTTNVNRPVVDSGASNSPSRFYRVVAP